MRSPTDSASLRSVHRPGTTSAINDAELVGRAIAGDRWAESAIYQRHAERIVNLAARLLGDRTEAYDVLHDVFLEALDELDTLLDPAALRPWLMQRAVRQVHRRFRRRKLVRALGLGTRRAAVTLETQASPQCSPEARAELARIERVLDEMPMRARIAWVLHRVEGETLPAVAAIACASLATVKRDIARVDEEVDRHVGGRRGVMPTIVRGAMKPESER